MRDSKTVSALSKLSKLGAVGVWGSILCGISLSAALAGDKSEKPKEVFQRGTLLLSQVPKDVGAFLKADGTANLARVRQACNFLTDRHTTEYKGVPLAKRKNAVNRHTKRVCEEIERSVDEGRALSASELDRIYELAILERSYFQRSKLAYDGITPFDKLKMLIATKTTDGKLRVVRESRVDREAQNWSEAELKGLSAEKISELDPKTSPFWQAPSGELPRSERFDRLAKAKKTKFSPGKVVIFASVSNDGSSPKMSVREIEGDDEWSIKWGDEVHTDVIGSRLFAALGFDVDHPNFAAGEDVTIVFADAALPVKDAEGLRGAVQNQYSINLRPWISKTGVVDAAMAAKNKDLSAFVGKPFVQFKECALEGRPDKVKRLGGFGVSTASNSKRRELRGALLAHLWIDNWDTREDNTLITTVNEGEKKYRISGAFSDLGTALGVKINFLPTDFRVGLPNEVPWELVAFSNRNELQLHGKMNAFLKPYGEATYADLRWMARQIAEIDGATLKSALSASGLPSEIQTLYFNKLAARRAQLLDAFQVADPHPIAFDRKLMLSKDGQVVIRDGELLREIDPDRHPEGFLNSKGRFRGFGYALEPAQGVAQ